MQTKLGLTLCLFWGGISICHAATAGSYGRLPLYFEPNQGQTNPDVRYVARGGGGLYFIGERETVLALRPTAGKTAKMRLVGGNSPQTVEPLDRQPGVSNYLIGQDELRWRTGVAHYGKVRFGGVYPGVDMIYYGAGQQLEYDFVVAPGADPLAIRLAWDGVSSRRLNQLGDLVMQTPAGEIVQKRPVVYQDIDGRRRDIPASYRLLSKNRIGFRIGTYDPSLPLVIDPVLNYSTYLGGSGDDVPNAIAVDASFSAYIAGFTTSTNFPTTGGALRGSYGGGSADAFVTKIDPTGSVLIYSTFIGGGLRDEASAIAVDAFSNVYITGTTGSFDFPIRNSFKEHPDGQVDAFVTKLNSTGTAVLFSTFYGGVNEDHGLGIAIDQPSNFQSNNVYVAGWTASYDFPGTPGAFQPQKNGASVGAADSDAFVLKINVTGNGIGTLIYSTLLGGSGFDFALGIAVDAIGNAYVVGYTDSTTPVAFPTTPGAYQTASAGSSEAFVTKFNVSGSGLLYSTLIGGSDQDFANAISVDLFGRASVTGGTLSPNFPTTIGAFRTTPAGFEDGFVIRVNSSGSGLIYSTLLGGDRDDVGNGIRVGPAGDAFVIGTTFSATYPLTQGSLQQFNMGALEGVFTILNPAGTGLQYSTYIGGAGNERGLGIALDSRVNAYLTGDTTSTNFPIIQGSYKTTNSGSDDGFIAKFSDIGLAGCTGTVTPTGTSFPVQGGTASITIGGQCNFTGISSATWASITGPITGQGAGTLNIAVQANAGVNPRASAVSVANNVVSLIQSGNSAIPPYADVPLSHQYLNYITLIKNAAITSGCTAALFCPDDTTTRGQMAVFIIRSLFNGDNFPFPATPYFLDVPAAHPYFKWIQKMREMGITTGCTAANLYCPGDAVTRGQMAVFLIRARVGTEFDYSQIPYFSDVPMIHPYFSFIQKMKELGITSGCTQFTYCPDSPNIRGQMAVFLTRAFLTPW